MESSLAGVIPCFARFLFSVFWQSFQLSPLRPVRLPGALVFQLGEKPGHASVRYGPGQPPVANHPRHVQGFHDHAARRLGYRRRSPVVVVISDLSDSCVDLTALGIKALASVTAIRLALGVPGPGNASSTRRNRRSSALSALGFATCRPFKHTASVPTPTSIPMVWPSLNGGVGCPSSSTYIGLVGWLPRDVPRREGRLNRESHLRVKTWGGFALPQVLKFSLRGRFFS